MMLLCYLRSMAVLCWLAIIVLLSVRVCAAGVLGRHQDIAMDH